MAEDSINVSDTTAAASNALAWHDLNTRLSAHYQRAACVGIDAAVAAYNRLGRHHATDAALDIDDDDLIEETRCHAMAYYLNTEGGE